MTDDLVTEARKGGPCAELGDRCRAIEAASGCFCAAVADRIEALTAQLESTLKDRALILAERDRTFVLMLARAEKAEAENDRAWAALWDILACETPHANATVTRMVAIAKAALKGESRD